MIKRLFIFHYVSGSMLLSDSLVGSDEDDCLLEVWSQVVRSECSQVVCSTVFSHVNLSEGLKLCSRSSDKASPTVLRDGCWSDSSVSRNVSSSSYCSEKFRQTRPKWSDWLMDGPASECSDRVSWWLADGSLTSGFALPERIGEEDVDPFLVLSSGCFCVDDLVTPLQSSCVSCETSWSAVVVMV